MGIEIERKFLVDHNKWRQLTKPVGTSYRQGYLANTGENTVRVRIAGSRGFITIKGLTKGISRKEFEYPIPVDDAAELLDDLAGPTVEKIRYRIDFEGHTWEVDEFSGDNEGLIIAEIELSDEAEAFKKPDWIADEVSSDERYYNSNLSKNPYKNWGM